MKKIGFAPVLTQTSRLFALCLLGGVSTVSMADIRMPLATSQAEGEKTQVSSSSKGNNVYQDIKHVVAVAMDDREHTGAQHIKEPFLKNTYRQQDETPLRLTRIEIEKRIRQQVMLAMNDFTREKEQSLALGKEDKLARLIREEVLRALSTDRKTDSKVVQKNNIGWVYLGRFEDNKWLGSPLAIGADMPEKGKKYVTSANVNIRKSFSALQPVTRVLEANTSVKLTDVVKRGDKGHYWAKVSML